MQNNCTRCNSKGGPADHRLGRPLLETLAEAVVRFNDLPAEAIPAHRQRMSLILHVPALQAHSTLRYADWRGGGGRLPPPPPPPPGQAPPPPPVRPPAP